MKMILLIILISFNAYAKKDSVILKKPVKSNKAAICTFINNSKLSKPTKDNVKKQNGCK